MKAKKSFRDPLEYVCLGCKHVFEPDSEEQGYCNECLEKIKKNMITKSCSECEKDMIFQPRVVIDTWDCYHCKKQELIKPEESRSLRKQLEEMEQASK